MGRIAVGTSGWAYDHWGGNFYPDDLPKTRRFQHLAARFPTVEINYSFYRLPSEKTVRGWHDQAPRRFRFALKGSRLITHARRLRNCEEAVGTFVERSKGLKSFLGAILWQLPPDLEKDAGLLEGFLSGLPGRHHAVEFRHPSWLDDEVFDLLRSRAAALVCISSKQMPAIFATTTDFTYVRLRGLEGAYEHDYTDAELAPWVGFLEEVAGRGQDGFVYFNNDGKSRAPANAERLIELLDDAAVEW